ncbi:MAG: T9SS type A sorting domain-containing protein [Candidatus Marinimicrobia bacterium]|nr:T9SS type A sorting domain-containing protein [Candidatus Neomarinimicrobiota bacterium]
MKRFWFFLLFISGHIFCQDYINVQTTSGYKHDFLSNIKNITFDGSGVNFKLKSGSNAMESMDGIIDITFGGEPLGDESLPVELVSFSARQQGKDVTLFWETAAEVNNLGFEIERKHRAASNWEKIGFVQGEGNSSTPVSYTYCDKNAMKYNGLGYRLKQLDNDGSFEYSPEISVSSEKAILPTDFRLHHNFPNPFNPITRITYEIVAENFTTLIIYDLNGREISTLVNENQQPGKYQVDFQAGELSSGVYFYRLTSGENTKLIKMLLMK